MKAVLFDLDGTVLDTLPDIEYCLNEALTAFGYPPRSREDVQAFVGDGAEKLVQRALPSNAENFGEVFSRFSEKYHHCKNERTKLYEGELDLLLSLKREGIKLAVVTNKPHPAAENCVKDFFPVGTFDCVLGDSGMFPVKPDPTLARYCALSMRVPIEECVFVGDGEADVLTAKNAHMKGVAVLWGNRTKEQLLAVGANCFAENYAQLAEILKKL